MATSYGDFLAAVDKTAEYLKGRKSLFQWLRNSKGRKVGVMVAFYDEGQVQIGWSLCNKKDSLKFDDNVAFYYALNRACNKWETKLPKYSLRNKLEFSMDVFARRANAYFKQAVHV